MKATKKPIVVDYFVYTRSEDFHAELHRLTSWVKSFGDNFPLHFDKDEDLKVIESMSLTDGIVLIQDGDVIIRESGNYSVCPHDIFYQTYNIH